METSAFKNLGLSITGLGTQYPPFNHTPATLEELSTRFYKDSPAMRKVLAINRFTGIDTRSSVGDVDEPLVNQPNPPTIAELHATFLAKGVPLGVRAAVKALAEARITNPYAEITHLVSTTCTDSGNPGFDHHIARELGLSPRTEKVLLHGVGCSGGLAALRTAGNLALGHAARGRPARVLVVALEVSTILVRSELDSIDRDQQTRIGAALFSDCASAVVVSNGMGEPEQEESEEEDGDVRKDAVYDLLGWEHQVIPDTEADLGFDVDPCGWKVVLSPRVPKLTAAVLPDSLASLLAAIPPLPPGYRAAADFDWAMHPGGATILSGAERCLDITAGHQRASYDTYIRHGNSSSATIFSVLDRLRSSEMDTFAPDGRPKEYVVGCAFGPGITVEMCMLRRRWLRPAVGLHTPPEMESEPGDLTANHNGESDFLAEALHPLDLD